MNNDEITCKSAGLSLLTHSNKTCKQNSWKSRLDLQDNFVRNPHILSPIILLMKYFIYYLIAIPTSLGPMLGKWQRKWIRQWFYLYYCCTASSYRLLQTQIQLLLGLNLCKAQESQDLEMSRNRARNKNVKGGILLIILLFLLLELDYLSLGRKC